MGKSFEYAESSWFRLVVFNVDQSPMVSPPNHRSWLSGMKPAFRSIPVTSDCGACRNLLKRKKAKTSGRPSGPLDKKDLEREGLKQKKAGRGIQNFFTSTTPAAPVHASQPAPARAEGDDAPAGPAGSDHPHQPNPLLLLNRLSQYQLVQVNSHPAGHPVAADSRGAMQASLNRLHLKEMIVIGQLQCANSCRMPRTTSES